MILVRRGWLTWDNVRIGDETIGYNPRTQRSEWTRIIQIHHYEDAEVWRIGNKHWRADVTPDHRWWSDTLIRVQPAEQTCPECGWVPGTGRNPALGAVTRIGRNEPVRRKSSTCPARVSMWPLAQSAFAHHAQSGSSHHVWSVIRHHLDLFASRSSA